MAVTLDAAGSRLLQSGLHDKHDRLVNYEINNKMKYYKYKILGFTYNPKAIKFNNRMMLFDNLAPILRQIWMGPVGKGSIGSEILRNALTR